MEFLASNIERIINYLLSTIQLLNNTFGQSSLSIKTETRNYHDIKQFIDSITLLNKYPRVLQDQACKRVRCFNKMNYREVSLLIKKDIPFNDFQDFNKLIGNNSLSFDETKTPNFKVNIVKENTTWKFWRFPVSFIFLVFYLFYLVDKYGEHEYQAWILGIFLLGIIVMFPILFFDIKKSYELILKLKEKYKDFFEDTQSPNDTKDNKSTLYSGCAENNAIKNTTTTDNTGAPKHVISVDSAMNTNATESTVIEESTESTVIEESTESTKIINIVKKKS